MFLCRSVTSSLVLGLSAVVGCSLLSRVGIEELPSLFCYKFFFYSKFWATDAVFFNWRPSIFNPRIIVQELCESRGGRPGWAADVRSTEPSGFRGRKAILNHTSALVMMMNWCLMSSDVMRHIRDKLWPMPKHGAINLYVHGNQKAR